MVKVVIKDSKKYYKYTSDINGKIVGSLDDANGVVSGFSTNNYVIANAQFYPKSSNWEMNFKVTTGNDVASTQFINSDLLHAYGPNELCIESSKFKVFINPEVTQTPTEVSGTYTVLADTTYWIKFSFNGTSYNVSYSLDGETFVQDISVSNSQNILRYPLILIGIDLDPNNGSPTLKSPFLGSIDFKECNIKIGGNEIWRGVLPTESTIADYDFYRNIKVAGAVKGGLIRKYYKYGTDVNGKIVGSPSVNSGVVSGFSSSNYVISNTQFYPQSFNWELDFKVTTGSDVSTRQFINSARPYAIGPNELFIINGKFKIAVSSTGSGSATESTGTYTVLANTIYWLKFAFTGSAYTLSYSLDGETFVQDINVSNSNAIKGYPIMLLGVDYNDNGNLADPFLGSIDFNECSATVNGNEVWVGTVPVESTISDYDFYRDIKSVRVVRD